MLFQTPKNDRVAVVDDSSAETRDIARAGVVPLLCRRRRRPQKERQNQENSVHRTAPHQHDVSDPDTSRSASSARSRAFIAFSSEVDTGSREENASKQKIRASVLIQSEPKRL
jgi:hypothetical protein